MPHGAGSPDVHLLKTTERVFLVEEHRDKKKFLTVDLKIYRRKCPDFSKFEPKLCERTTEKKLCVDTNEWVPW